MDFYERKLKDNPTMPKYNHSLAALYVAENRLNDASNHYKQVMTHAPNNVMARNDYALLLSNTGKKGESIVEIKKAMLVQQDHPLLRKNAAALTAKSGIYGEALEHATRAVQMEPFDPVNHRNIAKIYSIR
jgi:predicted Zn-dependent protease